MKGSQFLRAICFSWIVAVATSTWGSLLLDNHCVTARPCIRPMKYHGWMYPLRGGSNDNIQSDNETDEENEVDDTTMHVNPKFDQDGDDDDEDEGWEEPPSPYGRGDAWTEDEDVGETDLNEDAVENDRDMFLAAQEFVNNQSAPEETAEGYDDADEYHVSGSDIEADAADIIHAEEVKSPVTGDFQDDIAVTGSVEMEEDDDNNETSGDYTHDEADVESVRTSTTAPGTEKEVSTSSDLGDRNEWQDMVEEEEIEDLATFTTTTQATDESRIEMDMSHQQSTDDDSMAFVDRMELADDEGETMLNGLSGEGMRESEERHVVDDDTAMESVDGHAHTSSEELEKMSTSDTRVIDSETERILIKELNFHRHEVARMTPEIALVLAEKRLYRPLEGIPKNWCKNACPEKQDLRFKKAKKYVFNIVLLPRYAFPIVLAGLAVYGYLDLVEMFARLFVELKPEHLQNESEDEDEEDEEKAIDTDGDSPTSPVTADDMTYDIASIAPGAKQPKSRAYEDETWLDKVITRISESIRVFLSIEI